jgi:hypothetical protein
MLEASLKEMRQRRGKTKTWLRPPLAIAAGFALSVGLLLFGMAHRTKKEDRAVIPGGFQTAAVSAYPQMEMATNPGPAIGIVESRQYPSLVVENSSVRQPVEILGDMELLALFPDKAAGLVANSQGTIQLLLLDSRVGILLQ